MAVMVNAERGENARDDIIVATILLESRIPFKNSKIKARIITITRAVVIAIGLRFFYNNIRNNICRLIASIRRVGQMPVNFAQL
jgi:hypothetical protein